MSRTLSARLVIPCLAWLLFAWFAAGCAAFLPPETVTIAAESKRPGPFIGVGYHAFFPIHARQTTPEVERILHERWKEVNPSFVRVTHEWGWNVEHAVRQIEMMKQTKTSVYLTTWNPQAPDTPEARDAYAARVGEMLKDLVIARKLDHIKWYCMANELSLPGKWAALHEDLPRFADCHRRIFKALESRGVPVGLLATDASPIWKWDSIPWAIEHMDDITAAYGGHHYIGQAPDDLKFYGFFHGEVQKMAALSHAKNKPFIMGEFGAKPFAGPRHGFQKYDSCLYFDTPLEPLAALQTAEAIIAAVNGGADAIGYWTFADFPDDHHKTYANKWGTFRWDGKTFARRAGYYAVGLMVRNFRGPASIHETSAPSNVRSLALRSHDDGLFRVALINRRSDAVRVKIAGIAPGTRWEARIFNPKDVEAYQRAGALLNDKNAIAPDWSGCVTIPPQCLVVLVEKPAADR